MTTPLRIQVHLSIGVALLALCGTVGASLFQPVLDEFWIVKDSTEIFRDSFDGGGPPPSGPDDGWVNPVTLEVNPTTYSVFGLGGIASETGGKLTLTPSLGAPTVVTTTFADLATDGVRLLSTNTNNSITESNFLGIDSSFSIHGLYDMSSLPTITGQSFGIPATDRATGIGNEGDNTFALFVGMSSITGDVTVFLRHLNFEQPNNPLANAIIASVSIQSLLTGADQIELILSKEANTDLLSASYSLYDIGDNILGSDPVGVGVIYNNENYIRAQFSSTDRIPIAAVPEPETYAMLLAGLGLMGFVARRRKQKAA